MSGSSHRWLPVLFVSAVSASWVLLGAQATAWPSLVADEWRTYNHDAAGSRQSQERLLAPDAIKKDNLSVLWRLSLPGAVHGTPAVAGGTVYAGDFNGGLYAVAADTGFVRWTTSITGTNAITGTPLVASDLVVFADLGGSIHGVDRSTGLPAWEEGPLRPHPHVGAAIFSSPVLIKDEEAVIGVASSEETLALAPVYSCCSFRGSVVAFNPKTGKLRWQTYLITDDEAAEGSSGAGVWSTPTYDSSLNLIYVSTGNNYSEPATAWSDAIVALDPQDGDVVWATQLHADDVWNFRFPFGDPDHPDFDFGDSPQVFRLAGGRAVVGAGQKSGFFHLLDARTGRLLDNLQVVPGGHLGGLFADSAIADGITYANGSDWEPKGLGQLGEGGVGHVVAIRSTTPSLKLLWDIQIEDSPQLGPVTVANDVVYFLSSRAGDLHAVDARTGEVLARRQLGTGISGPSVSGGRVFVGTGDGLGYVSNLPSPGGSLVALGLPTAPD